jgi:hypothetical protein
MQGIAVLVRVDCDGSDIQFVGAAKDSDGDFTAIGNQEFLNELHAERDFQWKFNDHSSP